MLRARPTSSSLRIAQLGALAFSSLLTASCGSSRAITLRFEALAGDAPFACGAAIADVGSTGTTFTPTDLRFYVYDVRAVVEGREVPILLDDDGVFQNDGVALLDFETGGSECESGTGPTHTALTGMIEGDGAISAIRFRVGVPEARNHLDAANAPSPLNFTSMYWGWEGGYKFMRFEGRSTGQPNGVVFHLGATSCSGDARAGTRTCANSNRPELEIALPASADLTTGRFVVDLADWLSGIDLDNDGGGEVGCMSSASDPDCASWFTSVGLPAGSSQRLVQYRP